MRLALSCLVSALCLSPARADELNFFQQALAQDWIVTLSADVSGAPAYDGARHWRPLLYPGVAVRRVGAPFEFSTPDDAFGPALFDNGWLKAGPVLAIKPSRSSAGNPELRGLHFLEWTIEGGAFVEYWPSAELRTRVEIARTLFEEGGAIARLSADYVARPGLWTLSAGPRVALADGPYQRAYFSVSPTEAAANGRVAPYVAKAGLRSVGLLGAASYPLSDAWRGTLYAGLDRLVGPAGASPIPVVLGSRNQVTLGAIASYSFRVDAR